MRYLLDFLSAARGLDSPFVRFQAPTKPPEPPEVDPQTPICEVPGPDETAGTLPDGIRTDPPGWQVEVSAWPHDRWSAWRKLSANLQPPRPTAEEIRAADLLAYALVVRGMGRPLPAAIRDEVAFVEMLAALNRRGLMVDGVLSHPRIGVGTVTNRVTYHKPAAQTWEKERRLASIGPVEPGRSLIRADFSGIEPRILLSVLRRERLIDWTPGPGDVYGALVGDGDRRQAKVIVNRVVNGGRSPSATGGPMAEFVAAAAVHRERLAADAAEFGYVLTLSGRRILLDPDEENHAGKAVNRLIQGSASDIFNRAAARVDSALRSERLSAAVAFLLFDELWCESAPEAVEAVTAIVRREMEGSALALGVEVPVRFDDTPGSEATP